MKKLFLLGFAILLLAACENQVRYTQSSAEIDVINTLINEYENGNWENWKSHYSDTVKIYHNSNDKSMNVEEASKALQEGLTDLSSYEFVDDEGDSEMVIDDKGRTWVNFWGLWRGTLAANNKELEIPVHLTFQMIDLKVVREYGYWDNAPSMMALMEIDAAKAATEAAENESEEE
jgi:hypothetical protein